MQRTLVLALALTLSGLFGGCCCTDPAEQNKEIALSMIRAVNERDFAALDDLVADDVRRHCAATPEVNVESLQQFKDFLHQDLSAVPDAQQEVNLILAEGDLVAVHATYRGTQTGPMGPFPASGKKVELPYLGILRIEGGKIAEIWAEWDNVSILTQLGHFPPPAPTAESVEGGGE